MHPMNRVTTLAVALVALVALPRPLRADPIAITGGTVQVAVGISSARITFLGDDFMVRTGTEDFRTSLGSDSPFPAGTSINLGGVWHPTDTRGGDAIVNGVYYPELYFGFSTSGGTFVTPSVTPTGLGEQILAVPFTFSGFVTAWATPNPGPEDVPVFSVDLFGGGTATAALFGLPPEHGLPALYSPIELPGADYQLLYAFSPGAAPVPEPGTIMLLGTGVIGLLGLRYRRPRRDDASDE
jgi:PEP-CTERM motif